MILAGLRPEIVLDIATRAISFWSHQMYKEKLIHYTRANNVEAQLNHVESSYETLIVKMKNDMEAKNKNFETLKVQFADQTKRIQELENYLNNKDRQLQSMQVKYESARRETLTATIAQEHKSPTCHSYLIDRIKSPKFLSQQGMLQVPSNHCHASPNTHQGVMHHCHRAGHHQRVCASNFCGESTSKMAFADKPFEFNPSNQEKKARSPACNTGNIHNNNTFQFD
ncbi:E3 ubiquitin-protein ligase CCNB1IP1 isoform X2 [Nilaparvata lugens]|nr:E3 ubiquitin-protein ligase CCNB1IP1 isoform X2 [Nilaparvata lugens]